MANDLETMRQRLRDILYDVEDETWNAGEKDDILDMAVRRLSRRLPRPIDPEAAAASITLVTSTYFYSIDSSFAQVDRVFYTDSDSDEIGFLDSGWEVVGDILAGTAKLHVSPQVVEQGGTLTLYGHGRYSLATQTASQTNAIPDDYVPVVLQWSRAEAYSRLLSDRARFRQWQNQNQVQNVSINELLQMTNEANARAEAEWALVKKWHKPVIGRI